MADDARKKAAGAIDRIKRGLEPFPAPVEPELTVAGLAERYMQGHVAVNCRQRTQANYRHIIERHILPKLGELPIGEVDRSRVPEFHYRLGKTPQAANNAVRVLCGCGESDTISTSARLNIETATWYRVGQLVEGPVRHEGTTEGGRMRTRICTGLGVLAMVFSLAGSVGAMQQCPKGLEPVTEFRMFFGLADETGKAVTEDEWQRFLADTVTPRFRAGLTVFDARGQWLPPSGELQREPVKVVIGALSSEPAKGIELADEISVAFAKRFNQDPVFRMAASTCAGLHP